MMKKFLIIGPPASGKSTFAKALGKAYSLAVIHQDIHFFEPDHTPIPTQRAMRHIEEKLSPSGWVVEGNYNQIIERCLPEADCVIFLDFWRISSLYRVIKRRLTDTAPEEGMAIGKTHKVPLHLIKFILWDYPKIQRLQLEGFGKGRGYAFYHCRSWSAFRQAKAKILSLAKNDSADKA